MKLDELVCLTAWSMAYESGEATEKEKNRVRAMRAFYKMDVDRFNAAFESYETNSELLEQVKRSDPVTKILCIYGSMKVAWLEFEDSADGKNCTDEEWNRITQLSDASKISSEIREAIGDKAYDLIHTISASENIDDEDVMELLDLEREDTTFSDREIIPLLEVFFNKLEELDQLDIWEENFLGLTKNLRQLEALYGKIDIQQFKNRYEDLKYNINHKKQEIQKLEKEQQKLEKLEELHATHEFSVAHGITYCKYCGTDKDDVDCRRELGHRFTIKNVADPSRYSDEKFLQPMCSKCGQIGWKNGYSCN
jgi:hypothetical protein